MSRQEYHIDSWGMRSRGRSIIILPGEGEAGAGVSYYFILSNFLDLMVSIGSCQKKYVYDYQICGILHNGKRGGFFLEISCV